MIAARERLKLHGVPLAPPAGEEPSGLRLRWSRRALSGRLVELSTDGAAAGLSLAMILVWEAQREDEPVAWVATAAAGGFYPPDVAANGIDLEALAVVRVPDARAAARAAERLARSGAFGLLVLDLGERAVIPPALQGRLMQQAQRHDTAVLCLTCKPPQAPSLGPLVSLRAQAQRQRAGEDRFRCALAIAKDKRHGPGWTHAETLHGPPGLR